MTRKGLAVLISAILIGAVCTLGYFSPKADSSEPEGPVLTDKRPDQFLYKAVVTGEFFNGQTKKFEQTTLEYYGNDVEWNVTTSYSTAPDPSHRSLLPRRTVSASYHLPGSALSIAYGRKEFHPRGIGFSFSGADVRITDQITGKVIWENGELKR